MSDHRPDIIWIKIGDDVIGYVQAAEVGPEIDRLRAELATVRAGVLREIEDEADHLAADARDGLRNGSEPGEYEVGVDWLRWIVERLGSKLEAGQE